jgi:predicted amidophosphoribosyltransferase
MFNTLLTGAAGKRSSKSNGTGKPIRLMKKEQCPCCERNVATEASRCPHCGNSLEIAWWDSALTLGHT